MSIRRIGLFIVFLLLGPVLFLEANIFLIRVSVALFGTILPLAIPFKTDGRVWVLPAVFFFIYALWLFTLVRRYTPKRMMYFLIFLAVSMSVFIFPFYPRCSFEGDPKFGEYYDCTCLGIRKNVETILLSTDQCIGIPLMQQSSLPQGGLTLSLRIQSAVDRALTGPPIEGFQPIPKGSKLLSASVSKEDGYYVSILNFNKEIVSNGEAAFEDTFTLIEHVINEVIAAASRDGSLVREYGPGPTITSFFILIEGQPLNEVFPQ